MGEEPGRRHPARHVGQLDCDRLVLDDRLAHRVALLRVRAATPRSAASATPTPRAATLMRPSSSAPTAWWNPRPSTPPSRWSAGTNDVVEHDLARVDALVAELAELAGDRSSRASLGTMNSDMPRWRGSASTSVLVSTARQLPSCALVIHVFVPRST